jgi:hypothetical protein
MLNENVELRAQLELLTKNCKKLEESPKNLSGSDGSNSIIQNATRWDSNHKVMQQEKFPTLW